MLRALRPRQVRSGSRSLIVEGAGQQGVRVASIINTLHGRTAPSPARRCAWLDVARGRGAIRGTLGGTGLQAVTTNLNINFLAKPKPGDLAAKVGFIRLRAPGVGEIEIHSRGLPKMDCPRHGQRVRSPPPRPAMG
jgi:hypothetical protein